MTYKEAEKYLEDGCPHNAWTDDVCGACAKDLLEVLRQSRGKAKPQKQKDECEHCGNTDHSTEEHSKYQAWLFDDDLPEV